MVAEVWGAPTAGSDLEKRLESLLSAYVRAMHANDFRQLESVAWQGIELAREFVGLGLEPCEPEP